MARSQLPSLWGEEGASPPMDALRRRIDRLFADFGADLPSRAAEAGSFGFVPDAEIHEGESEVTVRLELAGVDPGDIDITVADRTIEVSGQKKAETAHREGEFYRSERSFGSFSRAFTLGFSIPVDTVDARFDKGVLTIRIPKPAGARETARKIAIRS